MYKITTTHKNTHTHHARARTFKIKINYKLKLISVSDGKTNLLSLVDASCPRRGDGSTTSNCRCTESVPSVSPVYTAHV